MVHITHTFTNIHILSFKIKSSSKHCTNILIDLYLSITMILLYFLSCVATASGLHKMARERKISWSFCLTMKKFSCVHIFYSGNLWSTETEYGRNTEVVDCNGVEGRIWPPRSSWLPDLVAPELRTADPVAPELVAAGSGGHRA